MSVFQAGGTMRQVKKGGGEVLAGLVRQGEQQLEKGCYPKAVSYAEKVLRADPNHLGALELLARAYWRTGEFELGLDALRHLIRLNPYEPGYQFMRGGSLQALGHYGEAVRAYSRCLDCDNSAIRQSAALAIRELEAWQEDLIAGLLRDDRRFQLEYAVSPSEACQGRGFAFSTEKALVADALPSAHAHAVVWERPS